MILERHGAAGSGLLESTLPAGGCLRVRCSMK